MANSVMDRELQVRDSLGATHAIMQHLNNACARFVLCSEVQEGLRCLPELLEQEAALAKIQAAAKGADVRTRG